MSQSLNLLKNKADEMPNNIEAEQSVIGSILLSNEIFDEVNLVISSKNFYDPIHKKIFEALEKLIFSGLLANPITLKNYFEKEKDELNVPEYLIKIVAPDYKLAESLLDDYANHIITSIVKSGGTGKFHRDRHIDEDS